MAGKFKAIISDVHGNLEAQLEAVVDDMGKHGAEELYCLGDVVGYGPNPGECLDILMNCRVFLLGNHEESDAGGADRLHARSDNRGPLDPPGDSPSTAGLRPRSENFIHLQSADDPRGGRLACTFTARRAIQPRSMSTPRDQGRWQDVDIFRLIPRCCFVGPHALSGHFHRDVPVSPARRRDRRAIGCRKGKTLCNVGSVGQPRDGDWRACYVLFDGKTIHFRRVEYDVETTVDKMKQFPELRAFLKLYRTDQ